MFKKTSANVDKWEYRQTTIFVRYDHPSTHSTHIWWLSFHTFLYSITLLEATQINEDVS